MFECSLLTPAMDCGTSEGRARVFTTFVPSSPRLPNTRWFTERHHRELLPVLDLTVSAGEAGPHVSDRTPRLPFLIWWSLSTPPGWLGPRAPGIERALPLSCNRVSPYGGQGGTSLQQEAFLWCWGSRWMMAHRHGPGDLPQPRECLFLSAQGEAL